MRRIPIHAGGTKSTVGRLIGHALVDDRDYPALARYRWHLNASGYVARTAPRVNGVPQVLLMHREVLGLTKGDGLQGDHINRDKLDNRRQNLRIVTGAQNVQNVPARGGTSQHRGVYRRPSGRWAAQVRAGGRSHALGTFDTEAEAADAARQGRERLLPYSMEVIPSR